MSELPLGYTNTKPEKPPVFGSWKTWYGVVLGVLAVLILLFHLLTQSYR